jgi:tetratricopeptide (TPR) repeat protein
MSNSFWFFASILVLLGSAPAIVFSAEAPQTGNVVPQTISRTCARQNANVAQLYSLLTEGRYAEAQAKLPQALATAEQDDSPNQAYRACVMGMLGFTNLQLRRPERAAEWYHRALDLKPLPADLQALLTGNLAHALFDANQLERAEEVARQAIALLERAFGPESPEVLFPRVILASVQVRRGEYAIAEPVFRRALDEAERSWGPSSYEAAQGAANLASIHLMQGRYALARGLYQKSLAGLQRNPMRAIDEVPLVYSNLALSCAAGGARREADVWLQRALESGQGLGPEHPAVPVILERAAATRFFQKQYGDSWALFERAIALFETRYGARSTEVLGAMERYSGYLRSARDKSRARDLEKRRKALAAKN